MSLEKLSKATGIGKGHLSSIECGFVSITVETIECISAGLDLSPLLLFAFPDENELAAIVDLVRQIPTTRYRRLRRILEKWIAEFGS